MTDVFNYSSLPYLNAFPQSMNLCYDRCVQLFKPALPQCLPTSPLALGLGFQENCCSLIQEPERQATHSNLKLVTEAKYLKILAKFICEHHSTRPNLNNETQLQRGCEQFFKRGVLFSPGHSRLANKKS